MEMAFSEDLFLGGRLLLRQPLSGHRVGTDALLAAAITPPKGRVCDLGAGVGLIGLALVLAGAEEAVLVERDPVFAVCAAENLKGFKSQSKGGSARLEQIDIFDRKAMLTRPALADQSFDAVVTNPPYDQSLKGRRSPRPLRQAAHAMAGGSLEEWLQAATRLLRHGGTFAMIHRADRIADVLAAMPARLGGRVLRFVQPRVDQAATRLLISAVAGSRAALTVLPPLILHDSAGKFMPEVQALHEGRARLRMQPGPMFDSS
jgi:tRNA1(Val) A37 N6-methylase TrmN6